MIGNGARKPLQLLLEDVLTHLSAQHPHHLHREGGEMTSDEFPNACNHTASELPSESSSDSLLSCYSKAFLIKSVQLKGHSTSASCNMCPGGSNDLSYPNGKRQSVA